MNQNNPNFPQQPYQNQGNNQGTQFNQGQQQQYNDHNQLQGQKLSADPGATVLGIIGLIICLTGCCCGFFAILSLILGIIGLVWSVSSSNTYRDNPEAYTPRSYSNVKTAKILNIIAVVLSVLFFGASMLYYGTAMQEPFEAFKKMKNGDFDNESIYTDDFDTESVDEAVWEYEEEIDSLTIENDSLEIEEEVIEDY